MTKSALKKRTLKLDVVNAMTAGVRALMGDVWGQGKRRDIPALDWE